MANNIITTQYINNEVLVRFLAQIKFAKTAYRGFEKDYKNLPFAIGENISYRLEENFIAEAGWEATEQSITQRIRTLPVTQVWHVMYAADGTEMTLKRLVDKPFLDEHYMGQARALAENAEGYIAGKLRSATYYTAGSAASPLNSASTINFARARMTEIGIPEDGKRYMAFSPMVSATVANSLQNSFNKKINTAALMEGYIGHLSGFDCFDTIFAGTHESGGGDGTTAVDGMIGCGQINATVSTGNTIVLKGLPVSTTNILKKDDIIEVSGSYFVHKTAKTRTTQLAQFVVSADVGSDGAGLVTVTVEPTIAASGPYQIIDSPLQVNANVRLHARHDVNYAYHRNAIVFAAPPIHELAHGVTSTNSYSDRYKISMTNSIGSDIRNFKQVNRLDILYGAVINADYVLRVISKPFV